jgi:PAS domain S-box-containing protein
MYGYTKEELLQRSTVEIVVPEDREMLIQRLTRRIDGEENADRGETTVIRKDGQLVNIEYSIKRIEDGKAPRMVSLIRDITEQKKAEKKLKQKSEDLVKSNAELEQFAYVASHDLREPLRTVSSYVQLLQNRYADKLDKQANEFIDFTVDGVKRMDQLINDLLSYSRVSRIDQEFETVNLEDTMEIVKVNLRDIIQKNNAVITSDPLPEVKAIKLQMVQLFQNLLSNAIKFRSERTPVIHIGVKKQKLKWEISVHDNGIGIDEKYKEKIFVIFQRLHSRKVYQGTGIGLAICKKIAERHGGKIWVESEPGKGSTFYFTIKDNG